MARILVIDDDPDLRLILQHVLQAEGHCVVLASDGQEGVREQRNCQAELIVIDIFMPNKEGIETIQELRMEFPDAIVIAMSGGGRFQAQGHLFTAKELGAAAILRKPFEMTMLLDFVNAALSSSSA